MWSRIQQKYRHSQKCITSQIRISPPQLKARKEIYYIYKKGSHLYLLIQITTKHRKLKRLPFTCHRHHSESTLTIQRTRTHKASSHAQPTEIIQTTQWETFNSGQTQTEWIQDYKPDKKKIIWCQGHDHKSEQRELNHNYIWKWQ